ncbi:hypothetical protein ACOACO_05940 [Nocardioides sp. CPCC 205120]|uniref:hypothetical protein n=1 Tax=Nocardioides sp. CPCC 205120 TaxID=3406462 RepID=UPI003B514104
MTERGTGGQEEPFARHGAGPRDLDEDAAGLLADVEHMAHAAADDGLPMPRLLEDLRLLCDLQDGEVLPVDLVRVATLAWSDRQSTLARDGARRRPRVVDVEELVWALAARPPAAGAVPLLVLEVEPARVRRAAVAAAGDGGGGTDVVVGVVREVFGGEADLVAAPSPRHVLLLPAPGAEEVDVRAARVLGAVRALGEPSPLVHGAVHRLGAAGGPPVLELDDLLAQLRDA